MNWSNLLSISRIAALPVIILVLRWESFLGKMVALLLLLLAISTEVIDRYRTNKKKIGSFLDPFADKLLVMGLLLYFFWIHQLHGFWIALFIFRDVFVSVIRWLAWQEEIVLRTGLSHWLVYAQLGIVVGILLEPIFYLHLTFIFLFLSAFLAVFSMVAYSYWYFSGLRQRKALGRALQQEKIVILANRKSRGFRDIYRRHLLRVFAKRRKARIVYLPWEGEIFKRTARVVRNAKQVIIAGGDGTLESAANTQALQKRSLGFFPLGGGNAFYSYFYKGKRFEYLRSRFPFREQELDVLELEWNGKKKQTFFLSVGLDAEVMRLSKERNHPGFFNYFVGGVRVVFYQKTGYDLQCGVDGENYGWTNCINLTLAKIPYYGFGVRSLLGAVTADDGKVYGLAVVNTHSARLNKAVRVWALLLAKLNMNKSPLFPLRGKEITVQSEKPFPLQAGGDFLGYTTSVRVRVVSC